MRIPNSTTPGRHPRGFTLLELLVVIVVLSLIAALSAAAYLAMMERGRVAATQTVLRLTDDALQDRLESFYASTKGPGFNPNPTLIDAANLNVNLTPPPVTSTNPQKLAKVLGRLERMRGTFPQEYRDVVNVTELLDDVYASMTPSFESDLYDTRGPVGAYREAIVTAAEAARDAGTSRSLFETQLLLNESSECLYLIIQSSVREAMTSTVDDLPGRFVKDTDGDGMLEIVDGWERPVRFYRWPVDLIAYYIEIEQSMPRSLLERSNIDPERLLVENTWYTASRADFENETGRALTAPAPPAADTTDPRPRFFRLHAAYDNNTVTVGQDPLPAVDTTDAANRRSYPVIPVIISAGPDGEFGLYRGPTDVDPNPSPNTMTTVADDLSIRSARVNTIDEAEFGNFADNLVSLKLRAGASE